MKLTLFRLDTTNPITYRQIAIIEVELLEHIIKKEVDEWSFNSDHLGELEDLGQTCFQTSINDVYIAIIVPEDTPEIPLPRWFPVLERSEHKLT